MLLCRCQPSVPTTKVQTRISQVNQFDACKYCDTHKFVHYIISFRAGGNGPAAPVLAGPVFLKVVHFYKKQVIKKSASMIFGLVRLILLVYNGWRRHTKRSKIIGRLHIMLARYLVAQKAK